MTTLRDAAREVFTASLEYDSDRERRAYVHRSCRHDPLLEAEVESLLQAHQQAGDFLENSGPVARPSIELDEVARPGASVGPYKLLEEIGEGGFGVVFMAEQQQPIRRQVALKIIKLGMDTREVVARFEAERQALAMMEHPNIAKVLDAGATEGGRPYFVMELVRGVAITDFCDENQLDTRGRLELFQTVCVAIQHAHQKGVIHRDLKPSNVMVTLRDGRPVAKVIDFGVAKAIDQRLTERTMFTHYGEVVGTPQYMSPEQAEMSELGVDTRSDIYSLGVLLYELLAGRPPFEAQELRQAGFDGMRQLICTRLPRRPSQALDELDEATATTVAGRRATQPELLRRSVAGDLDWIVMKALEKDRERRYDTAAALAEDVGRRLADEAVAARPPSKTYLLRKNIRRHRALWLAGTAAAAALVAALAVSLFSLHEARDAQRVSEQQREVAQREAAQSEMVVEWLLSTLRSSDGESPLDDDRALFEAVQEIGKQVPVGVRKIPLGSRGDWHAAQGQLHVAVGRYLFRANQFHRRSLKSARRHFEKALRQLDASRNQWLGDKEELRQQLQTMLGLCCLYDGDIEEAEQLLTEAVAQYDGSVGVESIEMIPHLGLSWLREAQGRKREAESLWQRTKQIVDERLQPAYLAWSNLGEQCALDGRLDLAEPCLVQSLKENPEDQDARGNLGFTYRSLGRQADALQLFQEMHAEHVARGSHGGASWDLVRQSRLYRDVGDQQKSLELLQQAVAAAEQPSVTSRFTVLGVPAELALLLEQMGRIDEAQAIRAEIEPQLRDLIKEGSWAWTKATDRVFLLFGRLALPEDVDVEECLRVADDIERLVVEDWERVLVLRARGRIYEIAADAAAAVRWYEEAAQLRMIFNEAVQFGDWYDRRLVELYSNEDRLDEGVVFLEHLLATREEAAAASHPMLAFTRARLADLLIRRGEKEDLQRAQLLLRNALQALAANELTPALRLEEIKVLIRQAQEKNNDVAACAPRATIASILPLIKLLASSTSAPDPRRFGRVLADDREKKSRVAVA